MKALILDGSKATDNLLRMVREATEKKLKNNGWDVSTLVLRDIAIAPCLGCFGCWVKTPGKCVINDGLNNISKDAFRSDLLVFITPIIFGGYSPEIKKILDRWISIVLPFFKRVDSEVHHLERYKKHPPLLFFGVLPYHDDEKKLIFEKLVRRTAINSRAPSYVCEVILPEEKENAIDGVVENNLRMIKSLCPNQ